MSSPLHFAPKVPSLEGDLASAVDHGSDDDVEATSEENVLPSHEGGGALGEIAAAKSELIREAPSKKKESPWFRAARWIAALLALLMVAYVLRDADLATTVIVVRRLGFSFLWVLVPYAVGTALHAIAWRQLLVTVGRTAPVRSLIGILITADAVRLTFPGGAALGESMTVVLLRERHAVEASQGLASIAAKKALVTFTNGIYVLAALVIGFRTISFASHALFGGPWLVVAFVGAGLTLVILASLMVLALVSRKTIQRMASALGRLPIRPLRKWLIESQEHIAAADSALAAPFARGHLRALIPPGGLLLIQWGVEAVETVLILRLLAVPLDVVSGAVSEVAGSLIRSLAFILPAGIGVQDASYITLFDAMSGTHLATFGAAFVLVKRAKELVWILVGYLLLALGRRRPSAAKVSGTS